VPRRIFGPNRDEFIGSRRKLHNEELHNLHSSPNISRIIKSRIRRAGRVARMGRKGMRIGFLLGRQKERDLWEDLDVGGRIILKSILEI
jgi:hypothetical protein